jgi:hypothetical protein
MRLGQLARKLSIKPGEVIDFLKQNDVAAESGSNTRLDDEHVKRIVTEFAPQMLGTVLAMEETEEAQQTAPESPVNDQEIVHTEIEESDGTGGEPEVSDPETNQPEPIEIIRAPKVELPGLKVVGKIDLPEPKKIDSEEADDLKQDEEQGQRPRSNDFNHSRHARKQKHPTKNSVVLRREREERDARRQQAIEEEQEKRRRTENYQKKFKLAETKPSKKKVKKSFSGKPSVVEHPKKQPRNLVVKFKKWLFRDL